MPLAASGAESRQEFDCREVPKSLDHTPFAAKRNLPSGDPVMFDDAWGRDRRLFAFPWREASLAARQKGNFPLNLVRTCAMSLPGLGSSVSSSCSTKAELMPIPSGQQKQQAVTVQPKVTC